MAKPNGKNMKRFGGRWIPQGEQFKERNRAIKAVIGRFWYLIVPFLGIMCAHDSYVRPYVEDNKSIRNQERKIMLDRVDDLKGQIAALESQELSVQETIDTLHVPYINFYSAIVDSLVEIRTGYDQVLPVTKAKIDSLTLVRDDIIAENENLSRVFQDRSAQYAGLETWNQTLADSVVILDQQIAVLTDELFRVREPLEYKRKEALIVGKGKYPSRDDLPTGRGGN
jgi:hypothetical protein